MTFAESFESALNNLATHKLRSALTMLGMIFGVGAVIAMLSIGAGAERQALEMIERLGLRNVILRSKEMKDEELEEIRKKSQGLSWRDAQAIQDAVPGVDLVVARLQIEPYKVLSATAKTKATVYGVSSRQAEISRLRLSEGRFFDALDERGHAQVCVIGPGVRRELFGYGPALGSDLKVNDVWLTVVGVLKDEGGASAFQGVQLGATAREIYLPVTTASRKFDRPPLKAPLDDLIVRLDPKADPRAASEVVRTLVDRIHGGAGDFELVVPEALLEQSRRTQRLFSIVMGCIASISLLVGGIGIMNIMLATVLERTREIGAARRRRPPPGHPQSVHHRVVFDLRPGRGPRDLGGAPHRMGGRGLCRMADGRHSGVDRAVHGRVDRRRPGVGNLPRRSRGRARSDRRPSLRIGEKGTLPFSPKEDTSLLPGSTNLSEARLARSPLSARSLRRIARSRGRIAHDPEGLVEVSRIRRTRRDVSSTGEKGSVPFSLSGRVEHRAHDAERIRLAVARRDAQSPCGRRLESERQRLVPAPDEPEAHRGVVMSRRLEADDDLVESVGRKLGPGQMATVLPPHHLVEVVELVARLRLENGLDLLGLSRHVEQRRWTDDGVRREPGFQAPLREERRVTGRSRRLAQRDATDERVGGEHHIARVAQADESAALGCLEIPACGAREERRVEQ
jgi:putative ABC transport system permease protein